MKKIGVRRTRITVAILGFVNIYILLLGNQYFDWNMDLCMLGMKIGSTISIAYITFRSATGFAKSWNGKKSEGEEEIDV